jgi:hypothetical protein
MEMRVADMEGRTCPEGMLLCIHSLQCEMQEEPPYSSAGSD